MTGNLMADFKPSLALREALPNEILLGIENHRLVDRETDKYKPVKQLREVFSPERRRFTGLVTDIAFDYFLIKHWRRFEVVEFADFVDHCYSGLGQCTQWMPPRMNFVVGKMMERRWLASYGSLQGIAESIDQLSKRIRFKNNLAGSIIEVKNNYHQIETVFLQLFEHLQERVDAAKIER